MIDKIEDFKDQVLKLEREALKDLSKPDKSQMACRIIDLFEEENNANK